jgi:putative CocE/NonD family hydrolase
MGIIYSIEQKMVRLFAVLLKGGIVLWTFSPTGFMLAQAGQTTDSTARIVKDGVSCETVMVPMRDGTKLYTEVYRSVELQSDQPARLPVIISRSPYAREAGEGCFSSYYSMQGLAKQGYAGVYQSVRGTGRSEGGFMPFFQEKNDGCDLIAWAAKQPWSNGKVGMTEGSYLGLDQWQAALASPRNLIAIAPQVAPVEFHDDFIYRNGVADIEVARPWAEQFIGEFVERKLKYDGATPDQVKDGVKAAAIYNSPSATAVSGLPVDKPRNEREREVIGFLWEWYRHPSYDAYWAKLDVTQQISNVKVPVLVSGGWYDIFANSSIDSYIIMKQSGGTEFARKHTILQMECCGHGMQSGPVPGQIYWGKNKAVYATLRDRFMERYLKGVDNGIENEPPVQLAVLVPPDTGIIGDTFIYKTTAFPVPKTEYVKYSLLSSGNANTLAGDGSLDSTRDPGGKPDSFLYDPMDPVPTLGGNDTFGEDPKAGAVDQTEVEKRKDVLVYTASPATTSTAIIGKVSVSFWAQTDCTDTDFTAKLVDVHPDGFAHNVVDRIVRARYRKGAKLPPELVKPNVAYKYELDLGYIATMLRPGHRLRLEISSSNFPHYERNLNTGASNEDSKEAQVAHNTILHDESHPSYLIIPVVKDVVEPAATTAAAK